ncbi:hypothetical protein C1645_813301 [Glomus cerebriforme]|uniref:Uncharacterized protein n=1 Tax=Glomus cerebriforme TaxID=658196 RepID=A0A397TIK3_9GLOM|nr:hypothetical protein C1645_813301 [Glomus cerebriforme]
MKISHDNIKRINGIINNCLVDYDLDLKNVLKIMMSNSQNTLNTFYYSSLIGYFYQQVIECKVDKIKAFEIFSNAIKYSQKAFEWYLKSSKGGNIQALFKLGLCYTYGRRVKKVEKKTFEIYLKSAEGRYEEASWFVKNCYHDRIGILKDETTALYANATYGLKFKAIDKNLKYYHLIRLFDIKDAPKLPSYQTKEEIYWKNRDDTQYGYSKFSSDELLMRKINRLKLF